MTKGFGRWIYGKFIENVSIGMCRLGLLLTKDTEMDGYNIFDDYVQGTCYIYKMHIYVTEDLDINGERSIGWIEAGTSPEKTDSYFDYMEDLKDKMKAIEREEAKLLLLGMPFGEKHTFKYARMAQLNKENRKMWGLEDK